MSIPAKTVQEGGSRNSESTTYFLPRIYLMAESRQRQEEVDVATVRANLIALSNPTIRLPSENTLRRYARAGIDLSHGYPYFPSNRPRFVQDATGEGTSRLRDYVDPGTRADPEKKALFEAARKVKHLTKHIGVGVSFRTEEKMTVTFL
jgi:hypothetical protein